MDETGQETRPSCILDIGCGDARQVAGISDGLSGLTEGFEVLTEGLH